mgnify:CR=1 FL=1
MAKTLDKKFIPIVESGVEDEDIEYVKCEVKVPIQIVEFLEVFNIDVQKWLEEARK